MTLDPTRLEQIDRWAKYVKESNGAWKKPHAEFLDAQIKMANEFWHRLAQTPEGKKKIIEIFGIKNLDAVPMVK